MLSITSALKSSQVFVDPVGNVVHGEAALREMDRHRNESMIQKELDGLRTHLKNLKDKKEMFGRNQSWKLLDPVVQEINTVNKRISQLVSELGTVK